MRRVRKHVNPLADCTDVYFEGFGDNREIMVDIGSFRGEFVKKLAERFSTKNFIACEIRKPIAENLKQQFKAFDNVQVFAGDAGKNLRNLLEPSQKKGVKISRIFINFPDPWFKKRHKKRRFINERFLTETISWIDKETVFLFQTDQKLLFEETLILLQEKNIQPEFFNTSPYGIKTDWEKTKIAEGEKIFRMKFSFC